MKATFDLDADLYRAIRVEAARTDRSVKDVVDEALRDRIEAQEDAEDGSRGDGHGGVRA